MTSIHCFTVKAGTRACGCGGLLSSSTQYKYPWRGSKAKDRASSISVYLPLLLKFVEIERRGRGGM